MHNSLDLNYLGPAFANTASYWQQFLSTTCGEQLQAIDRELSTLALHSIIYPPPAQILRALSLKPEQIKVVILGQDPYHGPHEANGLAFAVNPGIKRPPSLVNIFKELGREYHYDYRNCPANLLDKWAQQGVLLLNASLTVLHKQANSLAHIGWQAITDAIIQDLNRNCKHSVFILWGAFARSKRNFIQNDRHCILESAHPSPLSAHRGFFGCNHFLLTNQYLSQHGRQPIDWLPT